MKFLELPDNVQDRLISDEMQVSADNIDCDTEPEELTEEYNRQYLIDIDKNYTAEGVEIPATIISKTG